MKTPLLVEETPLIFQAGLAEKIGLNQAILLQFIHKMTLEHEWIEIPFDQLKAVFPFWGKTTIQRTMYALEHSGLVVIDRPKQQRFQSANRYRVNYTNLEKVIRSK